MESIPYGYCHCGCGQRTRISRDTDPRLKWVRGQPRRFLCGHNKYGDTPKLPDRNPSGLCECGCGQATVVIQKSKLGAGIVKGHHALFVSGHNGAKAPAIDRNPARICHCGCGMATTRGRKYRQGHWTRTKPKVQTVLADHAARFWLKIAVGGPDECWLYTGATDEDGYGIFRAMGKNLRSHRIAYELTHGPLQHGMCACHTCDVRYPKGDTTYRRCSNPTHLFEGTSAENTADMRAKGRQAQGPRDKSRVARGERIHSAVLTAEQVRDIRASYVPRKVGWDVLAARHGVCPQTIRNILNGSTWSHVT